MTVESVRWSPRRHAFLVRMRGREWSFPYERCDPVPTREDPVASTFDDPDVGDLGFAYRLRSGRDGLVLVDQVLDHHADPEYVTGLLRERLGSAVLARQQVRRMPKREIARRMDTSTTQVYRLLAPDHRGKSLDQLVRLLYVLGCEVDVTVSTRDEWLAARKTRREAGLASDGGPAAAPAAPTGTPPGTPRPGGPPRPGAPSAAGGRSRARR